MPDLYPAPLPLHQLRSRQALAQRDRVGRREFLPVVVEVGEDLAARAPGGDPSPPVLDLGRRVVAVAAAGSVVEAHVGELPDRPRLRQRPAAVVGDHQRGAVLLQQPHHRRREPARVAELDAVAGRRHQLQRSGEDGVVAGEVLGQLPEDRAELAALAQRLQRVPEASEALLDPPQPFHVGEVAAPLDSEEEARRRALDPAFDDLALDQPVEGVVDLDGVEDLGVALEPARRRHPLVDAAPPGVVGPARAADPHIFHRQPGTPAPMPLNAILDVDGTLVDTNYHHALAWHRALHAHGHPVQMWKVHRHIGMGGDQILDALIGEEAAAPEGEASSEAEAEAYQELIGEVEPLEGARELIEKLREDGNTVILASSAKQEEVDRYLDLLDARDLVNAWTTSADVEATKPEPDLVNAALEKAGNDQPSVMVGDSVWDVEAAKRAGVPTLAVLTGGFSEEELREAGAAEVVEAINELRIDGQALAELAR